MVSQFSRSTNWFPLLFHLKMMKPVVLLDLNQKVSLIVVQGINSKLGKLTRLDQSRGDSDRITSLVELGNGYGKTNEKPNGRRNIFEEAKNLDILVKDKNGDTYMVPNTAFDVGML